MTLGNAPSIAYGIIDHNYVVGTSRVPGGALHAFIASPVGFGGRYATAADLNTLFDNIGSWVLRVATGINNRGEIVGVGMCSAGKPADLGAWLLTPPYYTIDLDIDNETAIRESAAMLENLMSNGLGTYRNHSWPGTANHRREGEVCLNPAPRRSIRLLPPAHLKVRWPHPSTGAAG